MNAGKGDYFPTFEIEPIGYFYSSHQDKYSVPHQPLKNIANEGIIALRSRCHFEQALEDVKGFDRIWVLFWFHGSLGWKPKVCPPRGDKKRGVFATRSPHRPNKIGLSCVELIAVEGLHLLIRNHDLLNETPIVDIKPYLSYADAFPYARQGWLEEVDHSSYLVEWALLAQEKKRFLSQHFHIDLAAVEVRLKVNPFPHPNHRIRQIQGTQYELAYKTWRFLFELQEKRVYILNIKSGYDDETLWGSKPSRWDDVDIHRAFIKAFGDSEDR